MDASIEEERKRRGTRRDDGAKPAGKQRVRKVEGASAPGSVKRIRAKKAESATTESASAETAGE
jgi:hypothetical protein